jgi:hypothetical protein
MNDCAGSDAGCCGFVCGLFKVFWITRQFFVSLVCYYARNSLSPPYLKAELSVEPLLDWQALGLSRNLESINLYKKPFLFKKPFVFGGRWLAQAKKGW